MAQEQDVRKLDLQVVERRCIDFIQKEVGLARATGGVVGVSGGVDSAVVLALTAKALGRQRTVGLMMPSSTTPAEDVRDAQALCDMLSVGQATVQLDPILATFPVLNGDSRETFGNLKARIRMALLYLEANRERSLVIGTSDRSELELGYFTKYGDGGVDIEPIGGLYKTEVRALARSLGIPERIASKPSSPRLWHGHSAADELGADYQDIDRMLDRGELTGELARLSMRNAHKTRLPPTLSFG